MQEKEEFTRYEIARILGARALQISMDAPMLLKISDEELRNMRFDALKIAEKEFNAGVLPISVKRPMPRKIQEKLHVVAKEDKDVEDEKIIEKEKQEEKEIVESAEEMGFENVQDEDYAPADEESAAAAEE